MLKKVRQPRLPPHLPFPSSAAAIYRAIFRPVSMFLPADVVVQAVIVGLAFASVVTWTVWLAKSIELYLARQKLTRGLAAISSERSLADAVARVGKRGLLPAFIREALLELRLSSDIADKADIKERVASCRA